MEFIDARHHVGLILAHCQGIKIGNQLIPAETFNREGYGTDDPDKDLRLWLAGSLPSDREYYTGLTDRQLLRLLAHRAMRHIIFGDENRQPAVLNAEIQRFVEHCPNEQDIVKFAVRLVPEVGGRIRRVVFAPRPNVFDYDWLEANDLFYFDLSNRRLRLEIYQEPQKLESLPYLQAATVSPRLVQSITN